MSYRRDERRRRHALDRVTSLPAGLSSKPIGPLRRHPTLRSQVLARATGAGPRGISVRCRHPPNQNPEGAGIDSALAHAVLPAVEQNVDQGVSNLSRRPQRTAVIPVGPDAPGAPELAVDRLRETD